MMVETQQEKIEKLQRENRNLRQNYQNVTAKLDEQSKRRLCPPDYDAIKKQNNELRMRIARQEKVIAAGNLTALGTLIDQYISTTRTCLKKIGTEAMLSEFSADEAAELHGLVHYMDSVKEEIKGLIVAPQADEIINPRKSKTKQEVMDLIAIFQTPGFFSQLPDNPSELTKFEKDLGEIKKRLTAYM